MFVKLSYFVWNNYQISNNKTPTLPLIFSGIDFLNDWVQLIKRLLLINGIIVLDCKKSWKKFWTFYCLIQFSFFDVYKTYIVRADV